MNSGYNSKSRWGLEGGRWKVEGGRWKVERREKDFALLKFNKFTGPKRLRSF
ncbi:MAG: hypothetical protein V1732_03080 [Patescibacteria group bacterium]